MGPLKRRSSHLAVLCKKLFLEILQNLQEKYLCRSLFLIKLQAWSLQIYWKFNSNIGVFLWIFRNFYGHLFYRTPPVATSEKFILFLGYEILSTKNRYRLLGELIFLPIYGRERGCRV